MWLMTSEVLRVRVEPKTKRKAQRLADAEGRSLSNWVRQAITEKIERDNPERPAATAGGKR